MATDTLAIPTPTPDSACLFCLEETQEGKPELLKCSCRFSCHPACWTEYYQKTHTFKCPICRTLVVANPLHVEGLQMVVIQLDSVEIPRSMFDYYRCLLILKIVGFIGIVIPLTISIILSLKKN